MKLTIKNALFGAFTLYWLGTLGVVLMTGCSDCGCNKPSQPKVHIGDVLEMKVTKEKVVVIGNAATYDCDDSRSKGECIKVRFPGGSVQNIWAFEAAPTTVPETQIENSFSNIKETR